MVTFFIPALTPLKKKLVISQSKPAKNIGFFFKGYLTYHQKTTLHSTSGNSQYPTISFRTDYLENILKSRTVSQVHKHGLMSMVLTPSGRLSLWLEN